MGDAASVVAHIVWELSTQESEKADYLNELNDEVKKYEPDINLCAYAFHDVMLPYAPTTLKKDRNGMAKQLDGYFQVFDGKLVNIRFREFGDGKYIIEKLDKR